MEYHPSPPDREKAAGIVRGTEDAFRHALYKAADDMMRAQTKILTITGPTCSGKTTASAHLMEKMRRSGRRIVLFSFDDFYRDRTESREIRQANVTADDTAPDYDSVDAMDLDCLYAVMEDLRHMRTTGIPQYDFVSGRRAAVREYTPHPEDIYILEGIQAAYPQVISLLGSEAGQLFIHVAPPPELGISGDKLRLFRRIVRDERSRGAHPAFTLHIWQNVRRNELQHLAPPPDSIQLNSYMAYEPYIISRYLLPLLEQIPPDSPYAPEAAGYAAMLAPFADSFYTPDMIPADSVFREFIG